MQLLLKAHKILILKENLESAQESLAWIGKMPPLKYAYQELNKINIYDWSGLTKAYWKQSLKNPFPGGILYNLSVSYYFSGKLILALIFLQILKLKTMFTCTDILTHGNIKMNKIWLEGKILAKLGFKRLGYQRLLEAIGENGNMGQEGLLVVSIGKKINRPWLELKELLSRSLPYSHRYPTEFCYENE